MNKRKAIQQILGIVLVVFVFKTCFGPVEFEDFIIKNPEPIPADRAFYDASEYRYTFQQGARSGKVLVVVYWATWCGACIHELPSLAQLDRDLSGDGVVVLPISIEDGKSGADIQEFFKRKGFSNLKALTDSPGGRGGRVGTLASHQFGIRALPGNIVIDSQGRVVLSMSGSLDWNDEGVRAFLIRQLAQGREF